MSREMTHEAAREKTCPLRGGPCIVSPCMMWVDTRLAVRERDVGGEVTGFALLADYPPPGTEQHDILPAGHCTLGSPR